MKDLGLKIKYVYFRYLLVGVLYILFYSFFRWFFEYKLGILHLKDELLDFWLPLILAFVVVVIWLRKRIFILNIKAKNGQGFLAYRFVAAITIIIPTIIAQYHVKHISSQLVMVASPYEINKAKDTDLYIIEDFDVANYYPGISATSRTGGSKDESLYYTLYFVVPLIDKNHQPDLSNHSYWYGLKFIRRINNFVSDEKKDQYWQDFYTSSLQKFKEYNYKDYDYLQGLAYSEDRDGYIRAIKELQKEVDVKKLIILEPVTDSFLKKKAANHLAWAFISFIIGAFVFLLMIVIPSVNYEELKRYKEKQTMHNDDVKDLLSFLTPNNEDFVGPLLILINLVVFVVLVFSGIGVISATPQELLDLGGNRRFEVLNGEPWRLFISMFLHDGLIHLMMNLVGIGITCFWIEIYFGRFKTLLIYLVSGIVASISSIFWYENTISVGASGAIFGMMGVMLLLLLTPIAKGVKIIFLTILGMMGGVSLLFGFFDNVDNAAHIGGLVTGFLLGLLFIITKRQQLKNRGENLS